MTWVKSRILRPDGTPIVGQCVKATLLTRPSWLNDSTGRVIGRVTTNSGPDGLWRVNLLPYTRIESQSQLAYYVVNEGDGSVSYIRVPEVTDPATELWLRDLLIEPPGPPDTPWISINRLSRLHDVDRESLAAAKPGDYLTLLPNGRWGATRGPMPLTVTWAPDPEHLLGVLVTVSGFGGAGARLEFGDGTPAVVVTGTEPVSHVYALAGAYTASAVDVAWPAFKGQVKLAVKAALHAVHAFLDADDDWRVLLWLDEPADATTYLVDWGDDSAIQEVTGQHRVPPRPRVPHQYSAIGTYTIRVTDTSTWRVVEKLVFLGEIGQIWTFPNSPLRPRIEALWLATGANWQIVNLNSGLVEYSGVIPPSGRIRGERTDDAPPANYDVEIREIIDGRIRRRSVRRLVVPPIWDWRLGVQTTWQATAQRPGYQDVTITPKTARANCVVSWGDGSPSETVAPGAAITHPYHLAVLPAEGWTLTVTEIGLPDPRTWTRLIGAPRRIGEPVLTARTTGAVDLDVIGVDGTSNLDWYTLSWGDGTIVDPVGAIGRWYPAHHRYAANGTYTITVDGPGMLAPITRQVTVVSYPAPIVTVTEARDGEQALDPTRRTVQISVDNRESGGPCLVRFGDNSPIYECAEQETFTHRYPPPATPLPPGWEVYYLTARSKADLTARGAAAVQIPYGAARTLEFTITQDGNNPYRARLDITAQDIRKTVMVTWEPNQTTEVTVSPVFHDYLDDGTYSVAVFYSDNSESYSTPTTIPFAP